MNEQVYIKNGGRYKKLGYSDGWVGFPADGVWIVQSTDGNKSSECILRIGELQDLRPATDLILQYKDKIVEFLMSEREKNNVILYNESYNDFVLRMLKEIVK